jgi:hypothetical protein
MLEFLSIALQAALVLAIPFLVRHAGELLIKKLVQEEFSQVPILTILARIQGLMMGGLLMWRDLDSRYFSLEHLFLPDSPWNITLSQFLLVRSNAFAYDPAPVIALLHEGPSGGSILALLGVVVLPLLMAILCLRFWKHLDAVRGMLACTGISVWTTWYTVYLLCLAFWSLYLLNFWALALVGVYIQYRQSRSGGGGH